jgi:hypothetical protein
MLSHTLLVAEDIYSELGISIQKRRVSLDNNSGTNRVDISQRCKLKKIYKKKLSTLLKYLKSQKLSKEVTQYGVGIEYKLSSQIQLTINVLADLDIKKPSKMIKDQQANIRLAISL